MTDIPDYVPPGGAPTQAVHNAPAPSAQWQGLSQDQLSALRTQLVTSIIQVVVKAVTGIFVPGGGIGGATSQLTDWASNIPVIGDLLSGDYINSLIGVLGGNTDFLSLILDPITQLLDSIFSGLGTSPVFPGIPSFTDLLGALTSGLQSIPGTNITGAGGMPTVTNTFTTMWDTLTSAFSRFGVSGVSLGDFASAAQGTAQSAASADELATINTTTLGIRTNNPVHGALERTSVTNIGMNELGTGATPSSIPVTQAASAIAPLRMQQSDTKGVHYFKALISSGTITGFYLNYGKMALDGSVTPLFSSGNLASSLTSSWSWLTYTFPGANQITHSASEVIVTEYQVVGTGTVSVQGLSQPHQTDHPVATTKRTAATRNTGASGPTSLSIAAGSVAFSGNTPKVDLGRSNVPTGYVPPEIEFTFTGGPFTYNIPGWVVAGNIIDVFAVGSGGGGQSGGYGLPGQGGEAGNWQIASLVYGTDITLGATTITGTVGTSAAGGFNPFLFDNGASGNSTTVIIPGHATLTATGGRGGGVSGNSRGGTGGSPGTRTIAGYVATGGAEAGTNQNGIAPGGGGGAGYPAVGHASGNGGVWFRARQS